MTTAYQTTGYRFPIPVLPIRFRRLAETTATESYNAIVDTGADMTIAPAKILIDLEAQDIQETNLLSQWGDVHPVVLYLVDLEVEGHVFPGVLVAGDETTDEIILGRNFLNLLSLFIDGPQRQTHLLDDRNVRRLRTGR